MLVHIVLNVCANIDEGVLIILSLLHAIVRHLPSALSKLRVIEMIVAIGAHLVVPSDEESDFSLPSRLPKAYADTIEEAQAEWEASGKKRYMDEPIFD